jgi:signal transduction histidine kinase
VKPPRAPGLRLRLAIAFATVAMLAVGLATLLSTRGVEPRLTEAAEDRIARSSDRLAEAAAVRYRRDGRWTERGATDLEHLALTNGLLATILRADGSQAGGDGEGPEPAPGERHQSVVVAGEAVGTLRIAPVGGGLLTPEDVDLRESLDRLHMAAGAIAVGIALLAALLLAQTLSAPLRRIRSAARSMEAGDLDARVAPGGDPEVRAVGQALNSLAEGLALEEEARKESVADLAHELRTPVGGLLARVEAAQDGVLEDHDANLEGMHAEVVRLSRLLDDLAKLADAERPGLLLDKRPVDLAAIAASEAEQAAPRFQQAGVDLDLDLRPAELAGDPDRLAQIVSNLLSNAVRYTERGGRVALRVAPRDGAVVLEVRDTGIGIGAEDLSHIFERFWRADRSRSRATGGTGVGLAIVRELAAAHGGSVEVESEPGRGSRFRLRIPAVKPIGGDWRSPPTARRRG